MHGLANILMLLGALALPAALWFEDGLPAPEAMLPQMHFEPVQEAVDEVPFAVSAGGVNYQVEPLYEYELWGLVVSRHDVDSWRDYLHKRWNDHLNVADLCVLWGTNIVDDNYNALDFSSGQFTCNFFTRSQAAFLAFDQTAISNNHLLTDDAALAAAIRGARIGDQIHLRGRLARYSHNEGSGFSRGTSTVRTDKGNGACETIWVKDFEVLQTANDGWRLLKWLALALLFAGVMFWMFTPVRARWK